MFRSLLLVPGSSIRMILAGLEVDAAVLILDLVDGVAPDQKPESRSMVAQILREIDFQGRKVLVRINSLRTEWGLEDARAAGKKIIPLCPFAAAQFRRHPEWSDLLRK